MAEVKLRYNNDADEVELTVDGEVALTSGSDVFESWVKAYNDKHKSVDEPVVEEPVKVAEPVEEKVVPADSVDVNQNVENSSAPEVDSE